MENERKETLTFSTDADLTSLAGLCGPLDENLRQMETILGVVIRRRGGVFRVTGALEECRRAVKALETLLARVEAESRELSTDDIQWHFVARDDEYRSGEAEDPEGPVSDIDLKVRRRDLQGRTPNQRRYLRDILSHDICFGVGPRGRGRPSSPWRRLWTPSSAARSSASF